MSVTNSQSAVSSTCSIMKSKKGRVRFGNECKITASFDRRILCDCNGFNVSLSSHRSNASSKTTVMSVRLRYDSWYTACELRIVVGMRPGFCAVGC
jgi:hypothetical protein